MTIYKCTKSFISNKDRSFKVDDIITPTAYAYLPYREQLNFTRIEDETETCKEEDKYVSPFNFNSVSEVLSYITNTDAETDSYDSSNSQTPDSTIDSPDFGGGSGGGGGASGEY